MTGEDPLPSLMINSGYGLHAVYLLQQSAADKQAWREVQRGLMRDLKSLQTYGAVGGSTFACVCHVVDRDGRTVGQGRGVAGITSNMVTPPFNPRHRSLNRRRR